jgi:hypothetical protein
MKHLKNLKIGNDSYSKTNLIMFLIFSLFLISFQNVNAQVQVQDTTAFGYTLTEKDTILSEPILLQDVVIENVKLNAEDKKAFLLLQMRVWRVYPYAKIASERLTALNKNMALLQTNKEKKKYLKIVENYLEGEFTAQLKKLSRKQGQILVKLIYRQTGITTFDLIKDYKSGWKAFWSNQTAHIFDIDLKTKYEPYIVNEDYLIETILHRAFYNGNLAPQSPKNPIDFDELTETWSKKK